MIIPIGGTPVWAVLRQVGPAAELNELVTRIQRISDGLPSGWPTGLEHNLFQRRFGTMDVSVTPIRHRLGAGIIYLGKPSRDHLTRRPPSEIAARRLWTRLDSDLLVEQDLQTASDELGGSPCFRTKPSRTTAFASGHVMEYAAPDRIGARVRRLLNSVNKQPRSFHPLLHATGIYYETLLIHPFVDGNGRLARLLFQTALRRTLGLRAPVFPLGPACAVNRPALIAAYLAWEFDRNARPLVDFIAAALAALIALYDRPKPAP